jgi:hypothetical protein
VIGNALFLDQPIAGFTAAADFRGIERAEFVEQPPVLVARLVVIAQELVKCPVSPLVFIQRRRDWFGFVFTASDVFHGHKLIFSNR